MISVSIVSHGHGSMVTRLVSQLLTCGEVSQIIVTRNIPEAEAFLDSDRIQYIGNTAPRGFGTNHNAAFKHCTQNFFCSLNPDIRLVENPFPTLLKTILSQEGSIGAPLTQSINGGVEDSLRRFPTFSTLLSKALGGKDGRYHVAHDTPTFYPEWIGGMFMLFDSKDFASLKGFDEKFFLYYEDVDICVRAWKSGMKVLACPSVSVIHDAQRASHRNLQHMKWHATSMMRYFWKHAGRLPAVPR